MRKDPLFTGSSRSGSYRIWIRFIRIWIRFCRIQIRQYLELDPFWPDLDSGSGSKDMVMDPFRLYPALHHHQLCASYGAQ